MENKNTRPRANRPLARKSEKSSDLSNKLRVIPLGGVEEVGINCTVYENSSEMVVVDIGLGFSEFDYYGVDHIVPNIEYVLKNKKKLKGIFITHGHLDHIGAIHYYMESLDFPHLYASQFTIELIKLKLNEAGILEKMESKLHIVNEKSILKFNTIEIEFFRVNHSIPQCLGLLIKSNGTKVVHTGDFKFDNSPINEPVADYSRLAKIGDMGIDLLLSDSTNSLRKGHPISESDVAKGLEEIVERAKGRVVVATFAGLVGRLYQLINIAKRYNRKVAIAGFSMRNTIAIAETIGYIKMPQGLIVPIQELDKYPAGKVMILTTGAQGEPEAALSKMAYKDYKGAQIRKGDTVVISSRTIAGNDRAVQNLTDRLMSLGALVKQSEDLDLYTSGHGYQEDQKIMLNIIKPKYFMPVHGYQYFLRAHGETARSVGIPENNIIISKRGNLIEGDSQSGFKIAGKMNNEPLIVSGSGVGDVGTTVLKEREQLASYGVLVIELVVNKDRELAKDPFTISRGFVYTRNSQELIAQISSISKRIFEEHRQENSKSIDTQVLRDEISEAVGSLVYKETEREPMIITIISFT